MAKVSSPATATVLAFDFQAADRFNSYGSRAPSRDRTPPGCGAPQRKRVTGRSGRVAAHEAGGNRRAAMPIALTWQIAAIPSGGPSSRPAMAPDR